VPWKFSHFYFNRWWTQFSAFVTHAEQDLLDCANEVDMVDRFLKLDETKMATTFIILLACFTNTLRCRNTEFLVIDKSTFFLGWSLNFINLRHAPSFLDLLSKVTWSTNAYNKSCKSAFFKVLKSKYKSYNLFLWHDWEVNTSDLGNFALGICVLLSRLLHFEDNYLEEYFVFIILLLLFLPPLQIKFFLFCSWKSSFLKTKKNHIPLRYSHLEKKNQIIF